MYDKLVEILEDFLSIQAQDLTQDTSFKDDLALDSLDLYELVVILEEEFNVEIPSDRLSSEIDTIEDLIRILKELGVED
ncbi:MAG: acyl carrier protein [Eubacterium sp.]|nr:acyl carrier protein [Eubacterium sp.]